MGALRLTPAPSGGAPRCQYRPSNARNRGYGRRQLSSSGLSSVQMLRNDPRHDSTKPAPTPCSVATPGRARARS